MSIKKFASGSTVVYHRFRNLANRLSSCEQQRYHIRVINQYRMCGNRAQCALTVLKVVGRLEWKLRHVGHEDFFERGRTAEKSPVQFCLFCNHPLRRSSPSHFIPSSEGSFSVPYFCRHRITPSHSVPSTKCTSAASLFRYFAASSSLPASSSVPLDEKFLPWTSDSYAIKNKTPELSHFDSRRDQRWFFVPIS